MKYPKVTKKKNAEEASLEANTRRCLGAWAKELKFCSSRRVTRADGSSLRVGR